MERDEALRVQIARLRRVTVLLRSRMAFLERSKFWTLRAAFRQVAHFFGRLTDDVPPVPDTDSSEVVNAGDAYGQWLLLNEPRPADLARMREIAPLLGRKPSVAVIVDDVDGVPPSVSTKESLYPEAVIVRTSTLRGFKTKAERFNAAATQSSAEFVVFCDPGVVLRADAVFEVALAVGEVPDADVIYGDWDLVDESGVRSTPQFLPDWSPDTFLSLMYTGTCLFYRRDVFLSLGGFSNEAGTALHYDAALKATEKARHVLHRRRMLHSSRRPVQMLPADLQYAVSRALARRSEAATITLSDTCPGAISVAYTIRDYGLTEIIIPTRDKAEYLERCLDSIFQRSTHSKFRVTVVDNGSREPESARLFEKYASAEHGRFRVRRLDRPFNFSKLINEGAQHSDAAYLILLNNDTEVITEDWIERLVGHAQRRPVGAVGARLLYGDGSLQHAGVVVGLGETAGHLYRGMPLEHATWQTVVTRNCSAVTAACLAVRRDLFDALGGFDERLAIEYNDVDFCLRVVAAGYRNVYVGDVLLYHHESISRRSLVATGGSADTHLFKKRWSSRSYDDPYYHPMLALDREDCSIRIG